LHVTFVWFYTVVCKVIGLAVNKGETKYMEVGGMMANEHTAIGNKRENL
jgi:hypothetical protein